jgi:hypothetical protein
MASRSRGTTRFIDDQSGGLPGPHATTHQDGGSDEINVAGLTGLLATPQTPAAHATTHQDGGSDEINVTGLTGLLATAQTPTSHATSHQNGGADEITVTGLSGLLADAQTPTAHATTHQNGGSDEINVAGLSGVLADPQTPTSHATSHQNGGSDEISVAGLNGLLADAQTPLSHKTTHENGGTDEISVAGLSGLLADAQTPLAHAASHNENGSDELDVGNLGSNSSGGAGKIPVSDGAGGVNWSAYIDRSSVTYLVGSVSGGDTAATVDFLDTGDGAAIASAITAINALGGGTILIKQGAYDFGAGSVTLPLDITVGCTILGVGPNTVIYPKTTSRRVFNFTSGAVGLKDIAFRINAASPGATGDSLVNVAGTADVSLMSNVFCFCDEYNSNDSLQGLFTIGTLFSRVFQCFVWGDVDTVYRNALKAVASTATIQFIAQASMVDGETVTLRDGRNSIATVFEFDKTGNGVTAGRVAVDISTAVTADDCANAFRTACNAVGDTLRITCGTPTSGLVTLTNDHKGSHGNTTVSETVANAGFIKTNFTGGVTDPFCLVRGTVNNCVIEGCFVISADTLTNANGFSSIIGNTAYFPDHTFISLGANSTASGNGVFQLNATDLGAPTIEPVGANAIVLANNIQTFTSVATGQYGNIANVVYLGNALVSSGGAGTEIFNGSNTTVVANNMASTARNVDVRTTVTNHLIRFNKGQSQYFPGGDKGGLPIRTTSAASPISTTTLDGVVRVNATSGARTINLPAVSQKQEFFIHIQKSDATANVVTVATTDGAVINGPTTLTTQFQTLSYVTDGTAWYVF